MLELVAVAGLDLWFSLCFEAVLLCNQQKYQPLLVLQAGSSEMKCVTEDVGLYIQRNLKKAYFLCLYYFLIGKVKLAP